MGRCPLTFVSLPHRINSLRSWGCREQTRGGFTARSLSAGGAKPLVTNF